jgi:hypothetical protein
MPCYRMLYMDINLRIRQWPRLCNKQEGVRSLELKNGEDLGGQGWNCDTIEGELSLDRE